MNAVDAVRPARSWFAPLLPGAAVVLAAGLVAVIALLMGQGPAVGPLPAASGSATTLASPSAEASITPSAPPVGTLTEPGATVEIDALDTAGAWGTIQIVRGDDLGGYEDAAIGPNIFIIEFHVAYHPDRLADPAQFGSSDWVLRATDPDAEHFFVAGPQEFERQDGFGSRPTSGLGLYPGAIDIFTTPTERTIAFAVARREANLALELVYKGAARGGEVGADEATGIPAREPGPPPDPVAPSPAPGDPSYVMIDGMPITVLDNAAADALFERPDTCVNPDDGYSVSFPDEWYTNTATGDTPTCSWFTPEFFEVTTPGEAPGDIWIRLSVFDGGYGYTSLTEVYLSEELTIDGREARRDEFNPTPTGDPDYRAYDYVIPFGDRGPTFVAATSGDGAGDYELAKAVLDRIMASLVFGDEPTPAYTAGMRVAIGSDHAGFVLKGELCTLLDELRVEYRDFGTFGPEKVDYPDFIAPVARAVARGDFELGVVLGGSGTGEAIVANKIRGIRCVEAADSVTARLGREHNDANVLSMGARIVGIEVARECLRAFLAGEFTGGRHVARIEKIHRIEAEETNRQP